MSVSRFLGDRGNIASMFGLAIVPVVGFLGAAIDYSRATALRSEMQGALDATSLMLSKEAAGQTNSQLAGKANACFSALFQHPEAQGLAITAEPAYGRWLETREPRRRVIT